MGREAPFPTCSRLFQAALSLFERENQKDEAAMWDYIVAGKNLPEEPAGDRVRMWAWKRWSVDLGKGFGTVPPISENDLGQTDCNQTKE